jgi:hypothetical protein
LTTFESIYFLNFPSKFLNYFFASFKGSTKVRDGGGQWGIFSALLHTLNLAPAPLAGPSQKGLPGQKRQRQSFRCLLRRVLRNTSSDEVHRTVSYVFRLLVHTIRLFVPRMTRSHRLHGLGHCRLAVCQRATLPRLRQRSPCHPRPGIPGFWHSSHVMGKFGTPHCSSNS